MATEAGSGGADAFLRFVAGELWPELERRYPVEPALRGLAGHSLGSLLALHALFQHQAFFNRVLASAPALWWDDRALLCRTAKLQRNDFRVPARLFLGIGQNDTASMLAEYEMLEDQLAARPLAGLEVISRRFPGRDHYNVLPDAFGQGLRALFA